MKIHRETHLDSETRLLYLADETSTGRLRRVQHWKLLHKTEDGWSEGATSTYDPCNSAYWIVREKLQASTQPEHQNLLAKW